VFELFQEYRVRMFHVAISTDRVLWVREAVVPFTIQTIYLYVIFIICVVYLQ